MSRERNYHNVSLTLLAKFRKEDHTCTSDVQHINFVLSLWSVPGYLTDADKSGSYNLLQRIFVVK